VHDVSNDPRIQRPEKARREAVASILSIPIMVRDNAVGVLRVYTSEPWELTLDDVNFVQALAQFAGMQKLRAPCSFFADTGENMRSCLRNSVKKIKPQQGSFCLNKWYFLERCFPGFELSGYNSKKYIRSIAIHGFHRR
jgi:hypothetical protein